MEVEVTIVPVSGKPTIKKVTVPASATLAEVAKAVGVKLDQKNMAVNGKPGSAETRVDSDSRVTITERPQGS